MKRLGLLALLLTLATAAYAQTAKPGRIIGSFGGDRPTYDVDFTTLGTLPSDASFSRSSHATYFNAAGVLVTATTDVARFDYSQTTGEPLGLAVEDSRTNVLLHNRDFTQSAWTKISVTAAKTATGIDGVSNSASLLTATANAGTVTQGSTSGSAAKRFSAYVKRVSGSGTVSMTMDNGSTWYDVTSQLSSGSFARVATGVTSSNPTIGFRLGTSGDSIAVDFSQLEVGSFDTSAIATAATGAVRARDSLTIPIGSWFAQGVGTLAWDGMGEGFAAGLQFDDGTSSNLINLRLRGSGIVGQVVTVGGSTVVNTSGLTAATALKKFKAAMAWATDDFASAVRGEVPVKDTSGSVPTNITTLRTRDTTTLAYSGWLSRVRYWPSRKSDQFLSNVTAD